MQSFLCCSVVDPDMHNNIKVYLIFHITFPFGSLEDSFVRHACNIGYFYNASEWEENTNFIHIDYGEVGKGKGKKCER